ncbi:MAG: folP [Segetibacter sp.]|nr:folP [Segetibacter sp.]
MFTINCKGRLLVIDNPIIMGIINVTPDSFYSGSRIKGTDAVLEQARKMLDEGATIVDIGGQSSRPGSQQLSVDEELQRVIPAIETINKHFPSAIISIDTYYARVAREAIHSGASIVNDISSAALDEAMLETVAALKVPYIIMHMQGTPQTMQQSPSYENVTREVLDYFIRKIEQCRLAGINDVIIDPGFGFGKTIQHNFQLLRELSVFTILERPILAGLSRKGTVYKTLGTTAEEALNGTTVLNTIALLNGAKILRVHDVKEAAEAIKLVNTYSNIS